MSLSRTPQNSVEQESDYNDERFDYLTSSVRADGRVNGARPYYSEEYQGQPDCAPHAVKEPSMTRQLYLQSVAQNRNEREDSSAPLGKSRLCDLRNADDELDPSAATYGFERSAITLQGNSQIRRCADLDPTEYTMGAPVNQYGNVPNKVQTYHNFGWFADSRREGPLKTDYDDDRC